MLPFKTAGAFISSFFLQPHCLYAVSSAHHCSHQTRVWALPRTRAGLHLVGAIHKAVFSSFLYVCPQFLQSLRCPPHAGQDRSWQSLLCLWLPSARLSESPHEALFFGSFCIPKHTAKHICILFKISPFVLKNCCKINSRFLSSGSRAPKSLLNAFCYSLSLPFGLFLLLFLLLSLQLLHGHC